MIRITDSRFFLNCTHYAQFEFIIFIICVIISVIVFDVVKNFDSDVLLSFGYVFDIVLTHSSSMLGV